jgi:hypothetical protein
MLLGVGIPVFRHLITIATGIPETIIRDTGRSEFNMCLLPMMGETLFSAGHAGEYSRHVARCPTRDSCTGSDLIGKEAVLCANAIRDRSMLNGGAGTTVDEGRKGRGR